MISKVISIKNIQLWLLQSAILFSVFTFAAYQGSIRSIQSKAYQTELVDSEIVDFEGADLFDISLASDSCSLLETSFEFRTPNFKFALTVFAELKNIAFKTAQIQLNSGKVQLFELTNADVSLSFENETLPVPS